MSLTARGLLLSAHLVVAIALNPLAGPWVDRMGVCRTYIIAVTLRTAAMLLLVVTSSPSKLFAVRSLRGVAIALRDPATASILSGLGRAPRKPLPLPGVRGGYSRPWQVWGSSPPAPRTS